MVENTEKYNQLDKVKTDISMNFNRKTKSTIAELEDRIQSYKQDRNTKKIKKQ